MILFDLVYRLGRRYDRSRYTDGDSLRSFRTIFGTNATVEVSLHLGHFWRLRDYYSLLSFRTFLALMRPLLSSSSRSSFVIPDKSFKV